MEKGKDRGGAKPLQATVVIRLIAGGYLVYLAHDLFKIYLNPAEGGKIYQLGCAAFFFAVGAGLAVWSGLKLIKGDYVKNGERADGGETQTDEESAEDAGAADGTKEAAEETPEADDTEKIINIQEDDGNDRS